ncbi:DMT family transporter [uncultured Mediterraneibacter sp.]|nr:DMT family transporter [uncultured Mediterraneibacter sp.]
MAGFLIALLSGALMSVQGVFNTQVTKSTGIWVSNGWVQLSAFALCVMVWLATGRESISTLWEVRPHYMLLGGVIGAGITWTVIQSVSALGPARSALLIVIAQLAVSYLIQLFGLFGMDQEPFSWKKAGGLLLAVAGIMIFQLSGTK